MQHYIRLNQLATKPGKPGYLPFSTSTIWRLVKKGTFPKPVKLGNSILAWKCIEIDAWLAEAEELRAQK
jgi:predicted DNA-binding transcriptional regulator AlpA